ncbi:uncharacterized protein RBU33_013202 [Hipposideros larvatus]
MGQRQRQGTNLDKQLIGTSVKVSEIASSLPRSLSASTLSSYNVRTLSTFLTLLNIFAHSTTWIPSGQENKRLVRPGIGAALTRSLRGLRPLRRHWGRTRLSPGSRDVPCSRDCRGVWGAGASRPGLPSPGPGRPAPAPPPLSAVTQVAAGGGGRQRLSGAPSQLPAVASSRVWVPGIAPWAGRSEVERRRGAAPLARRSCGLLAQSQPPDRDGATQAPRDASSGLFMSPGYLLTLLILCLDWELLPPSTITGKYHTI